MFAHLRPTLLVLLLMYVLRYAHSAVVSLSPPPRLPPKLYGNRHNPSGLDLHLGLGQSDSDGDNDGDNDGDDDSDDEHSQGGYDVDNDHSQGGYDDNNDQGQTGDDDEENDDTHGFWQSDQDSHGGNDPNTMSGWEDPQATRFSSARDGKCSKRSSSWDKEYLTDILTEPPMTNPFPNEPFLFSNFPIRTESITYSGNSLMKNPINCCGTCNIRWFEVTLHYWPHKDSNTECINNIKSDGFNLGSQIGLFSHNDNRKGLDVADPTVLPGLPHPSKRGVVHRPIVTPGPVLRRDDSSGPQKAVVGSNTFVSPYIYVEIPLVHASDDCGLVGKKFENVVWSYNPVDISSVVPDRPECWPALLGKDPHNKENCKFSTKSFNFADLPCPPESLRREGGNTFIYNTDAEYEPVLMQPWRIRGMDEDWHRCSSNVGWDPKSALTPAGALLEPPKPKKGKKKCKGHGWKNQGKCKRVPDEDELLEPPPVIASTTLVPRIVGVAAQTRTRLPEGAGSAPTALPPSGS